MTAAPPARTACSGENKGGRTHGAQAPPPPAPPEPHGPCRSLARRARRLWLWPSGGPRPAHCSPRRCGSGAAAPAGAPRGHDAAPRQRGRAGPCRRPLSPGQPPGLAPALACLSSPAPSMIWSRFVAPIAVRSGAPRDARGPPPAGCSAAPSAAGRGPRPAYAPSPARHSSPETVRAGPELRHTLAPRRHQRTQRRRLRRDPASSLATLAADLLKLILPP